MAFRPSKCSNVSIFLTMLGLFGLHALAQSPPGGQAPKIPGESPNIEWSSDDVDITPQKSVAFHGPFNKENITVKCKNLDAHDFLEISFDLLILRSWDGSVPVLEKTGRPDELGPDTFRLGLFDGPTLLYTTFSNIPKAYPPGFLPESRSQNYPSQIPGDHFDAMTGADSQNTLGYNFPYIGPGKLWPMDATYKIKFVVPHQDYETIVQFSGMHLQNLADESWGVAHLNVRGLDANQIKKPSPDDIASAFEAACNDKGTNQVESFQTLINGMDNTTHWIADQVTPRPIDAKKAISLIQTLWTDDEHLTMRDSAGFTLEKMGPQIEPLLRDARASAVGEQRLRIDWVMAWINVHPIADKEVRRVMLATRVLEIIGTPAALKLRKQLTQE